MFRTVHFAFAPLCIKSSSPEAVLGGVLNHLGVQLFRSKRLLCESHDHLQQTLHHLHVLIVGDTHTRQKRSQGRWLANPVGNRGCAHGVSCFRAPFVHQPCIEPEDLFAEPRSRVCARTGDQLPCSLPVRLRALDTGFCPWHCFDGLIDVRHLCNTTG